MFHQAALAWFIPRLAACEAATPRVLLDVEVVVAEAALGTVIGDEDGDEVEAADETIPERPKPPRPAYCML